MVINKVNVYLTSEEIRKLIKEAICIMLFLNR